MNELIEKLIDEFEIACHLSFDYIERENFAQAIQTACKAQRNACAREYYEEYQVKYPIELITNAKIEREDYENISD